MRVSNKELFSRTEYLIGRRKNTQLFCHLAVEILPIFLLTISRRHARPENCIRCPTQLSTLPLRYLREASTGLLIRHERRGLPVATRRTRRLEQRCLGAVRRGVAAQPN